MSRDIVHAQRGFRRRFCGVFVNRFSGGEALPMNWEEDKQLPTGNEIRALPGRNPAQRAGRNPRQRRGRNPTFGRTGAERSSQAEPARCDDYESSQEDLPRRLLRSAARFSARVLGLGR